MRIGILCFTVVFSANFFTQTVGKKEYGLSEKQSVRFQDSVAGAPFLSLAFCYDSIPNGLGLKSGKSYQSTKTEIEKTRSELSRQYAKMSNAAQQTRFLDSAMVVFTELLLNQLIPHWYGTEWDFNGHTDQPRQGRIACGYFVSTTLKDMGLHLNRYKFAQKAPEREAKTLTFHSNEVLRFSANNIKEKMAGLREGLYFVGLDNHVGYLLIHQNQFYFIHSDYVSGKVRRETTDAAEAFDSDLYYVVPITANKDLAKKWLTKIEITIKN
jgi:hypothetical protein